MRQLIINFLRELLMNIYTQSKLVRIDLLPSAAAYHAGDVVGTAGGSGNDGGKIPLAGALREPTRTGILQSLTLYDDANQKPALTVVIMAQKPSGNFADHAAPSDFSDDLGTILGIVSVAATDWVTLSDSSNRAMMSKTNIGLSVGFTVLDDDPTASQLYAVFITSTTPDWTGATAGELTALFGFLQD
jgi:hypothetical protein